MNFKLGRLPRSFDPRVPRMSMLLAGQKLPPPPVSINWLAGMPPDFGMMLNDRLGNCTCAALYHALQVWSFNASNMIDTEPDSNVSALYERACGYDPNVSGTDNGGNEQTVLGYAMNTGLPVSSPDGEAEHRIAAFVEVDPRNTDDVKRTIADCALAYIGFEVPQYIMDDMPDVWEIQDSGDKSIAGGHAVILAGYDDKVANVVSWGRTFRMTWDFFSRYTDECYAVADRLWVDAMGTTPGGLSLDDLVAHMNALKEQA
jgi:hypothetical protein